MSILTGIERANKQTLQFTDGLNFATSPTAIGINSLRRADNMEYANGRLIKADGVTVVYDASKPVESSIEWNGVLVYSSGRNLYYTDYSTETLIGTTTGLSIPCFLPFGDDELIVASGDHIQWIAASTWALSTITTSPHLNSLWFEDGRVWGYLLANDGVTNADYVYSSAVGAYKGGSDWDTTPQLENDWSTVAKADYDTTALYYEVGYKDGLEIVRVEQLSSDTIIYKEKNGRHAQYRRTGTFPDWEVKQISPSLHAYHTVSAINDNFVIGLDGFKSLTNVAQYGDVARDETGRKVNSELVKSVTSAARIWHLPSKKAIYIKPTTGSTVWCFFYTQACSDDTTGAWTQRIFSAEPYQMWEWEGKVYVAYGNKIGYLDYESDKDDSADFEGFISSKLFVTSNKFDPVAYNLVMENIIEGTGSLNIGTYQKALTFTSSNKVAFDDTQIAFDCTDIAAGQEQTVYAERFRTTLSGQVLVTLSIQTGKLAFLSLKLETGEV